MRNLLSLLAALTCYTALAGTVCAEQIDSPDYQSWAKHKPGTSVTYKSTTEVKMPLGSPIPTQNIESTITYTLKEVREDAVVVEAKIEGGTNRTINIPAKVDKDTEGTRQNTKGEVKDVKTGSEKVDVGGKSYDAKTHEMTVVTTGTQRMETHIKSWQVADVPGMMVKMESNVGTPTEIHNIITLEGVTEGK